MREGGEEEKRDKIRKTSGNGDISDGGGGGDDDSVSGGVIWKRYCYSMVSMADNIRYLSMVHI